MNSNYILPMMILSKHYKSTGEHEKSKRVESLALKLAKEVGKELQVKKIMAPTLRQYSID